MTSKLGSLACAGLSAIALLLPAPGFAQTASASSQPSSAPATQTPPRLQERRGRWYGWQILAGHVLTDAGVVLGLAGIYRIAPRDTTLSTLPLLLGIFSHAGVGLAVHGSRGEWGNAGAGLGLSLALPGAGMLVGTLAALFSGAMKEDAPAPPHLVVGAIIGLHLAGVIETAGFSYETIRGPVKASASPLHGLAVVPFVVPVQGGAVVGLGGSF